MPNTREVEIAAKAAYNANWGPLANDRLPPVWENTSEQVRNWMRRQARAALMALEEDRLITEIEQPGSLNPPARLGQQKC
jgi:hypothetical protein